MTISQQLSESRYILCAYPTRCRWCGKAISIGETCLWLPPSLLPLTKRRCSHTSPSQCVTADSTLID
jgi:hypothetical protein